MKSFSTCGVSIFSPPLIFIYGNQGVYGREQQLSLEEPTSRTNGRLPHRRFEAVGPMGRSADPYSQTTRPGANRPQLLLRGRHVFSHPFGTWLIFWIGRFQDLVGPFIHVMTHVMLWLVDDFYLGSYGAWNLHFSSISNVAYFLET